MAQRSWCKWLYAGGNSGGGDGDSKWDLKPIYRSLTAAYGWTYGQIDDHTLGEVNELFLGWDDYPPVYLSVKAIVEGLGGGKKAKQEEAPTPETDPEAFEAMQRAAMGAIVAKAGNRLPIMVGKDPGLPKAPPVFDFEELRKRNAEAARRRISV